MTPERNTNPMNTDTAVPSPTSRTVVTVTSTATLTLGHLEDLVTEAKARGCTRQAAVKIRAKNGMFDRHEVTVTQDLPALERGLGPAENSAETIDPRGLLQYVITDENWEEIIRVPVPLVARVGPDQEIILRWEGTPGVEDGRVPWRYRHAKFLKLLGSTSVHVLESWRVETLGELDEERGINTVRQEIIWTFVPEVRA